MRNWKALFLVLLFAGSITTGCDKNQKEPTAPSAGEGDGITNGQVTTSEEVEKNLVDGCEGSGTLAAAKQAFLANDFKEANRQARCAFNESVKADPFKPNTDAALFAFLSSAALTVESPQFQYVFDLNIAANTVFGTAGDPDSLSDQLSAKFTGDGLALVRSFFKFHEQKNHSIQDVVGKVMEFFTENFDDWHVLLKAMATDPKFINSKVPVKFAGNSSEEPFTRTEASGFLIWVDGLRFVAKVFPYYDLGITNSDSFADINTLVQDMNTEPKTLSLRGDANGASLMPYADLLLSSFVLGAGNIKKQPAAPWFTDTDLLKGVVPADDDDRASLAILMSQLKDSLKGGIVFLSESNLEFGIDLKKMFGKLPNAAQVSEAAFKVDGSGLAFRDEFLKELVKPFTVIRE